MVILIDKVTPIEIRTVWRIIEASWIWHYSRFMPRGALLPFSGRRLQRLIAKIVRSRSGRAFLGYRDGVPVAAMTLLRFPTHMEVDDLFVLPGHTSAGIGKALLAHARMIAMAAGKPLILWAMRDNRRARHFYEREGGKLFAFGKNGWGRGRYPTVAYRFPAEP